MDKIAAAGVAVLDHKDALRKVFFNFIIPHLQVTSMNTAIVVDSSKALSNSLKIQAIADPRYFYEGGVIYLDSRAEVGLQLADLAAYLVNRIHHTRQRWIEGKQGPFDKLVMDMVTRLRPLFVNVLELNGIED